MPIIVACPSCGGKLRVADELCGQKVRCPACQHIFDSPGETEPVAAVPRAPLDHPLDLTLGEPSSPPPTAHEVAPGLIGAIELKHPSDGPPPPEPAQQPPRRRIERFDRDMPHIGAEPDRGGVVLSLGIISLTGLFVWCIPLLGIVLVPICGILGLTAWILGQIDLRKMKRGQMDARNRGLTQAGWICGILGVVLNGLMILSCGLVLVAFWYNEIGRHPNTRPVPVAPPPKQPPKRALPPRNNPPDQQF